MCCATCKFWRKNIADGGGRCRRYPPQVVSRPNGDENAVWPQTSSYDMCGEYKNKDSIAQVVEKKFTPSVGELKEMPYGQNSSHM